MSRPHALIVDDSRTAQVRLRKMLERYDLDIDTADSAEEALSYLSYRQPNVVFMDHHMEGMDGLEALRIIKSNPNTAMIPVIMYTAERGDVYVGQARALGALDIISKEVIKPSSLERVLASLNLRPHPAGDEEGKPRQRPERRPVQAPEAPSPSSELQAVRSQIARLFEIHIADVRQQVADSTKFIVRRLSRDIEENFKATHDDEVPVLETAPERRGDSGALSAVFAALILVGLLIVAYQVISSARVQQNMASNIQALLANEKDQQQALATMSDSLSGTAPPAGPVEAAPAQSGTMDTTLLLEAISSASSFDPHFGFGEQALGERRIGQFAQLINLLDAAGFGGTLFVDLHFGNFCVARSADGLWSLPGAGTTLSECSLLSELDWDFPVDAQVAVGFASFLQTQPALVNNRMDLQLSSRGLDEPSYVYPNSDPSLSASEWNRAAARNNRIALAFSPM